MTYFQALYLCYVSLLTIGYGDLAPQSNAGRPFFVVWSLVAVPTMTILVADMVSLPPPLLSHSLSPRKIDK